MKKIITLFALLPYVSLFAQDEQERLKPEQKSISAELNIIPFSNNPVNMPYLRARYFIKENMAVRVGFSISGRTENPNKDTEGKTFTYNLRPGFEYHFKGNRKISPYVAAELDYAVKKSTYKTNSQQTGNVTIDGVINQNGDEQGFNRFGANLLAGIDIYLIKRLYIGFELGFGYSKSNFVDIKVVQNGTPNNFDGQKISSYGPTLNRAFRLGFFFN